MADVMTYLCDKVIITFFGNTLQGFADGDFVSVSPNGEGWTKKVGADGIVSRSRSNDYTHNIEITLAQTSAANTTLSAIAEVDRLTGLGKGPCTITDLSGNTLHFWAEAWIVQNADSTFGKEVGDRVWKLDTGQASIGSNIVGGN